MQFPAEDLGSGTTPAQGPRTPPQWTKDAGVAGAATPTPPNALVVGTVPTRGSPCSSRRGPRGCGVGADAGRVRAGNVGRSRRRRARRSKGTRPGEDDVDDTKKRPVVFSLIAGDRTGETARSR